MRIPKPINLMALSIAAFAANSTALAATCALADVQWMAGVWRSTSADDQTEERWAPLPDGVLMGSSWTFAKNGTGFAELMAITTEGTQVVMRLRHFDGGLKSAWEDKAAPMTFALTKCDGQSAVFSGTDSHVGERLTYARSNDQLSVLGEFIHKGKPLREEFNFRKARD